MKSLHPGTVPVATREARRGRSVLETIAVSVPGLSRAFSPRFLALLPPRARTRVIRHFSARTYIAFNRRDWEFNTLFLHPDKYSFRTGELARAFPGGREEYRGVDGYMEAMGLWTEVWSDLTMRMVESVEVAPDLVIHVLKASGQGEASGIRVEQEMASVVGLEDGLVTHHAYWWDVGAAFESVGLRRPQRSK